MWTCLIIVVQFLVILKLYLKWRIRWCESQVCLRGKTAVITGANIGIGYETAIDFAKRGARVILACRSESKAIAAHDQIVKDTGNEDVVIKLVDFGSLDTVKKCAADIIANERRLDILVNNAGAEHVGEGKSEDGLLLPMQVNYYGPVLFTELLLDLVKKSSGRIVNVASTAAKVAKLPDMNEIDQYAGRLKQYPLTKLCNILYTMELAKRLKETNVTTYSLHPGVVWTAFFRSYKNILHYLVVVLLKPFSISPRAGAQTTIYCSITKDIEHLNGQHFENCRVVKPYKTANAEIAEKLWKHTQVVLEL